jgi:hypothetical protein
MSTSVQQLASDLVAAPRTTDHVASEPRLTRQERVIYTVYAVMAAMVGAFLAGTVALWLSGV